MAVPQAYTVHEPLTAQDALGITRKVEAELIEIQRNWMFGCIRDAANNGKTSTILKASIYPINKHILRTHGYLINPYGEVSLKVSWSSDNA